MNDHKIVPIQNMDRPAHDNAYLCETCGKPVYWDGVFEGKWFHSSYTTAKGGEKNARE